MGASVVVRRDARGQALAESRRIRHARGAQSHHGKQPRRRSGTKTREIIRARIRESTRKPRAKVRQSVDFLDSTTSN